MVIFFKKIIIKIILLLVQNYFKILLNLNKVKLFFK